MSLRVLLVGLAVLLLTSCYRGGESISVEGVEVVQDGVSAMPAEWDESSLPSSIRLRAEVVNRGAKFKVQDARLRVSYGGRRVAMLLLEEAVTIPAQGRHKVEFKLRVAVARNSQSLPLLQAIRQGRWSDIGVDWQAKVRRGILSKRIEQPVQSASELLSLEQQEQLGQMFD